MMNDIDCSGTDEIVCPYCGYDFGDSWEYLHGNKHSGETQCDKCSKKFKWEAEYSVTYSTTQVKCLNGVPHDFKKEPSNSIEGVYEYYRCVECSESKYVLKVQEI